MSKLFSPLACLPRSVSPHLAVCLVLTASCGAAEQPAHTPADAPHSDESASTAAAGAQPKPEVNAAGEGEAAPKPKPSAEPTLEEQLAAAERTQSAAVPEVREVLYRVTPQGLIVEIDGARFAPKAEVVKVAGGSFGLILRVEAQTKDESTHTLLNPSLGPLSLSATIYDKKGVEVARHHDRRVGNEQLLLLPGNALTLERSWPSGEVKGPLWWGQKLKLEVGLWGHGVDGGEGRPVRKLFIVEMVAGAKTQAVISPPEIR